MIVENDIEVENKEKVIENYNKTYNNKVLSDFINTFWNDKKIQRVLDTVKIFAYNRKCIFGAKFQTTIQIKDVFDYVVGQVSPSD